MTAHMVGDQRCDNYYYYYYIIRPICFLDKIRSMTTVIVLILSQKNAADRPHHTTLRHLRILKTDSYYYYFLNASAVNGD